MVSPEVFLSCAIGLPDLLSRRLKGRGLANVTPELLILKSNETLGMKGLPVFIALTSQLLEMMVEQLKMEVAHDAILLPKII